MAKKLPNLPNLLKSKIYKTGQTRGADDDVIFQNRVNRNSTVLIPFDYYDFCNHAPDHNGDFENGFIVLISPEDYFKHFKGNDNLESRGIVLGVNALIFYETRYQWIIYNPFENNLNPATSRKNPLGGQFVARVPSTTSKVDEKITIGFNTSGQKGAGIRVYEYASSQVIKDSQFQLEYLFWLCKDSEEVAIEAGMTFEKIQERKNGILETCAERNLDNLILLKQNRIIDSDNNTICPLCLQKLGAIGFLSFLVQAEGRNVPDLTVTQINLFHIIELRTGVFNHKPYNLGWGHHHCNVVCKDSGIFDTLIWLNSIIEKNKSEGMTF